WEDGIVRLDLEMLTDEESVETQHELGLVVPDPLQEDLGGPCIHFETLGEDEIPGLGVIAVIVGCRQGRVTRLQMAIEELSLQGHTLVLYSGFGAELRDLVVGDIPLGVIA